jgi:hypothetical protein
VRETGQLLGLPDLRRSVADAVLLHGRRGRHRCGDRREEGGEVLGQLLVVGDAGGQRLGDTVQVVEQHARVGRALAAVPGGGAGDQRVDVRRDAGGAQGRRGDVLVDVLVGHLDRGLALVRLGAGEQLVGHHADRVDVGAGVAGALGDQLGGEVGDGADEHPAGRGVLGVGADGLGQPEVGDLDPAVVGDEDVLGLDVAVHDPGAVRGGERGDDRLQQRERPRRRHRALLGDGVAQGVPGDQLHRQEDGAVVLALVVDRHDVGVRQLGRGARLAHEAGGEVGAVTEAGVHDLDRDGAVQAQVEGLVDRRHAAAGDARAHAVAAVEELALRLPVCHCGPSCVPERPSYGRRVRAPGCPRPGVAPARSRGARPAGRCRAVTPWTHE